MSHEWYYTAGGKESGPTTSEQLKELAASGQLQRTDPIWQKGTDKRVMAGTVKGLFTSPPPIPSAIPVQQQHGSTACSADSDSTDANKSPGTSSPVSAEAAEVSLGFLNSPRANSLKQGVMRKSQSAARSDASKQAQQQAVTFWNKHREEPVFIVLMLIPFPVGLYLIWKHSKWTTKTKWIWTGAGTVFVWITMAIFNSGDKQRSLDKRASSSSNADESAGNGGSGQRTVAIQHGTQTYVAKGGWFQNSIKITLSQFASRFVTLKDVKRNGNDITATATLSSDAPRNGLYALTWIGFDESGAKVQDGIVQNGDLVPDQPTKIHWDLYQRTDIARIELQYNEMR